MKQSTDVEWMPYLSAFFTPYAQEIRYSLPAEESNFTGISEVTASHKTNRSVDALGRRTRWYDVAADMVVLLKSNSAQFRKYRENECFQIKKH